MGTGSRGAKPRGRWGERLVERYLQRQGAVILERNWRCEHGELDLVVRDGDALVIVEVKTRGTRTFGWPEEAVVATKVKRLRAASEAFLQSCGWEGPWRIDVATVERDDTGAWRIRWLRNAVQG